MRMEENNACLGGWGFAAKSLEHNKHLLVGG